MPKKKPTRHPTDMELAILRVFWIAAQAQSVPFIRNCSRPAAAGIPAF